MVLEFTVKNYKSFREAQTISFVCSSDKTFREENTVEVPGEKGVRANLATIIYGPNASGKSNLIKAMNFLDNFIYSSATKMQEGTPIKVLPFLYDSKSAHMPSHFNLMFVKDSVRYHYGITADKSRVYEEWLSHYPNKRRQLLYERNYDVDSGVTKWKFGSALKGENERIKGFVRSNSLYLSHAAQNNHPQLSSVFKWFRENFNQLVAVESVGGWTADKCLSDGDFCEKITKILKIADHTIDGLSFEEEKMDMDFFGILNEEAKNKLLKELGESPKFTKVLTKHKTAEGNIVELNMEDESDGTKRLFSIAGPCMDVFSDGGFMYVDELDRSLHAALSRYIISIFQSKRFNDKGAQLLCTSHDVSLLDQQKLFRRDQIWLMDKSEDGSSILYPLSDFSPRKDESLQKGYLVGRYGAVPFVGEVN